MVIYEPVFPHNNCKYNNNTNKYAFDIIIHMYHDLQPYVCHVLFFVLLIAALFGLNNGYLIKTNDLLLAYKQHVLILV